MRTSALSANVLFSSTDWERGQGVACLAALKPGLACSTEALDAVSVGLRRGPARAGHHSPKTTTGVPLCGKTPRTQPWTGSDRTVLRPARGGTHSSRPSSHGLSLPAAVTTGSGRGQKEGSTASRGRLMTAGDSPGEGDMKTSRSLAGACPGNLTRTGRTKALSAETRWNGATGVPPLERTQGSNNAAGAAASLSQPAGNGRTQASRPHTAKALQRRIACCQVTRT